MLNGHGDDLYKYHDIKINFSSNVYNHFDHTGLFAYLAKRLPHVVNYPEPVPARLEAALAADLGISPAQVMATNGATEAIYLIAQAFRGSSTLIDHPTFSEYADACRMHRHTLDGECPAMRWLCNPNNPTGQVLPKDKVMRLVTEHADVTFVIDASYAPFTQSPVMTAAEAVQFHNVLMLHSMTKEYAVPGLRLGFATGHETLLRKVRNCRMPWSVNQLAQDAGLYLLAHKDAYRLDLDSLMSERRRVAACLSAIPGIGVCPSDTHMLLCRISGATAASLKDYLARHHGILIRDASNFEGLSPSHFRIAVQTPEENDALVCAVSLYCEGLL